MQPELRYQLMLQEPSMSLIGVRELREQTSEVIRRVREDRAEYVVTYRGRPVAIILPLDTEHAEADELRRAWPLDLSTQDLIDAIRR
jgi:prevent-host-death family protein